MKVLILSLTYPRNANDYCGIFIKQFAESLVAEGKKVTVLTASDTENCSDSVDRGVEVKRVRYFFKPLEQFFYRPSGGLPQRIKKFSWTWFTFPFFLISFFLKILINIRKYDIVHCQFLPVLLCAIIPAKLFRKRVVVSLLGSDMNLSRKGRVGKIISHWILERADGISSINEEFLEYCKEYTSDRVVKRFIPNGISLSDKLGSKPSLDTFHLLFVGNLVKAKGIEELMYAVEEARRSHSQISLTLIGSISEEIDEGAFGKWVRSNSFVDYKGVCPHREVLDTMKQADLFIFPSHHEGMPNVVMEAMANGLPVLATRLPGIEQLIDCGIEGRLVDPKNPDELATALSFCINSSEELVKYSENALKKVQNLNLTWSRTAQLSVEFYQSCLSQ